MMKNKSKNRGVLIMALGHGNYYHMAATLAASIKANEDIPICLINNNGLIEDDTHNNLFDIVKPALPKSILNAGKIEYIKAKLFMYEMSPFEETIFLDVDQILIDGKTLAPIFEELKNEKVTFSNTGLAGESIWADMEEVKKIYGDKPFWNFHSEFVFFRKDPDVKKYFDAAITVFKDNKIKSAARFANATMADELAFQVAAIITGIYPHKENWLPNFWYARDKQNASKYPYELVGNITYSIGGRSTPQRVKTNYNTLANYYFAKLGLSNPYQVVDKMNFLPERKMI